MFPFPWLRFGKRRPLVRWQRACLHLESLESRLAPATFTVNNSGDEPLGRHPDGTPCDDSGHVHTGDCMLTDRVTLRSALQQIDIDNGGVVNFAVTSVTTTGISIHAGATIMGLQNGPPNITIHGGLTLGAQSVVMGVFITGATGTGLQVGDGSMVSRCVISGNGTGLAIGSHSTAIGNFIGTSPDGTAPLGNRANGISVSGSGNIIGGTTAADRNVISANQIGVWLDNRSSNNLVEGNYIGTNSMGTGRLGNGNMEGVFLYGGASGNTIGGTAPGAGNLISGNQVSGVATDGFAGNLFEGNTIGTDLSGMMPVPNGIGMDIAGSNNTIGGPVPGAGNLVSGNMHDGIAISAASFGLATTNRVEGNLIGVNRLDAALGNMGDGVRIYGGASGNAVGGTAAGDANCIAGNETDGVAITGAGVNNNQVMGNFIGVNRDGTAGIPNTGNGVLVSARASNNTIGGADPSARNIISSNGGHGVAITGAGTSGNWVHGNYIGTLATGAQPLPNRNNGVNVDNGASNNTIGGSTPDAGNLISGNMNAGIAIFGQGTMANVVQGNFIGTDSRGIALLPNGSFGLMIGAAASNNRVGGTTAGSRNLISANPQGGVSLAGAGTTGNQIEGNYIGTDIGGTVALANQADGVDLSGGAANNTVGGEADGAGNLISGHTGYGVRMTDTNSSGNLLAGNLIGTDHNGLAALPNHTGVALLNGASGNTIGEAIAGGGNTISGNAGDGLEIATANNQILGNRIGTDLDGAGPLGNAQNGVVVDNVSGNVIGGVGGGAANTVSGNGGDGIMVTGIQATQTRIEGNVVGTDASGASALGNAGNGVTILGTSGNTVGGTDAGAGNVISGNLGNGVSISAGSTNTIQGNSLGVDATGRRVLGNHLNGILISLSSANTIGGMASGAPNTISGNLADGININGVSAINNKIQGNYIGVSRGGARALGNGADGVFIASDATANTIGGTRFNAANTISGNQHAGIRIQGSANKVQANFIGTDSFGGTAVPNLEAGVYILDGANNQIGGTAVGSGNVISANGGAGVEIDGMEAQNNKVKANFIGVDVSGTAALGNGLAGVFLTNQAADNTIGGKTTADRNLISGNQGDGVQIDGVGTTANLVQGNAIGTDRTGTLDLGNQANGVAITGAGGNVIGGSVTRAGNTIAYSRNDGILVDTGTGNSLLTNSIFSSGRLGIELVNQGNNNQAFPVLISAALKARVVTIAGSLRSTPNAAFTLEFFGNNIANPSGFGEGKKHLGFLVVTTDAGGNAAFRARLSTAGLPGMIITATATDSGNNTSSFSRALALRGSSAPGPGDANPTLDGRVPGQEDVTIPRWGAGTVPTAADQAIRVSPLIPVSVPDAGFTGMVSVPAALRWSAAVCPTAILPEALPSTLDPLNADQLFAAAADPWGGDGGGS